MISVLETKETSKADMEIWQRVQVAWIVALATDLADVSKLLLLVFLYVQSDTVIFLLFGHCVMRFQVPG